jgi:hypothetical protein
LKTPYFSITKINFLLLFKKIIPVYTENSKLDIPFLGQAIGGVEILMVLIGGMLALQSITYSL